MSLFRRVGSGGGGDVTDVTATLPLTSSGGATPDISTSIATNKLVGRGTAGTGVMEEITLGSQLVLTGTTLDVVSLAPRVVTAAGDVTLTTADRNKVVVINKTVGAATTVNFPSSPTAGDTYTTKDGKGDAVTNNITLNPDGATTIDGSATYIINENYGSITAIFNGTEWNII